MEDAVLFASPGSGVFVEQSSCMGQPTIWFQLKRTPGFRMFGESPMHASRLFEAAQSDFSTAVA
jgi:hypothetical protein